MPNYLVESYLADSPAAVEAACECARSLSDVEAEVRYTRTIFLPGDETVLHVFAAPSPDALRQAARRAGLHCERVVEAVETSACRRGERSGRGRPGRASR